MRSGGVSTMGSCPCEDPETIAPVITGRHISGPRDVFEKCLNCGTRWGVKDE